MNSPSQPCSKKKKAKRAVYPRRILCNDLLQSNAFLAQSAEKLAKSWSDQWSKDSTALYHRDLKRISSEEATL